MVHTNPEFETPNLILDFEFDQHSESHKHVINIIMWFRDMGCYICPSSFARLIKITSISVIILNKMGDMGSP
jgi:hypothetical protein